MRVIVCGGRRFHNYAALERYLGMLHVLYGFTLLIHGGSRGADALAKYWAGQHHIDDKPFPADWNELGKAAGPIRNQQMLVEGKPKLVIAFPGGHGTKDMRTRAERAGVTVLNLADPTIREAIRQSYGVRVGRRGSGATAP